MTRANGRTSLIVGDNDAEILLDALDRRIGDLRRSREQEHTTEIAEELIARYKLFGRVQQARERLANERIGRGSGGAS